MHHCVGLARLLRGLHAAKVAVFRRPFEPAGTGEPSWEEEEERLRLAAAGLGDADVGWSAVVGLEVDDSDGGIVDDADRGLPPLRDMGTPRRGGGVGTSLLARFPRDKFDLVLVTGDARLKGALNRATAHQLAIELCSITLPAAPGSALAAAPGAAPAEWAEAAALALLRRFGGASDAAPSAAAYLHAKAAIDDAARSTYVELELGRRLGDARAKAVAKAGVAADPVLRVVDVGAGALSMLRPMAAAAVRAGTRRLHYVAIDKMESLLRAGVAAVAAEAGVALARAGGAAGRALRRRGRGGREAARHDRARRRDAARGRGGRRGARPARRSAELARHRAPTSRPRGPRSAAAAAAVSGRWPTSSWRAALPTCSRRRC